MNLPEFFTAHPDVAVAFSGGADSSCLLYLASKYAETVHAYFVKTEFQPRFEEEDARQIAQELDVPLRVLKVDVLEHPEIAANTPDRCYYCKKLLFQTIKEAAAEDGLSVLIDGSNASDDAGDRPGMRALRELSVYSPLRECGLTKEEVRDLARDAKLSAADKPAYACLATRIHVGEIITEEKLAAAETTEGFMFDLGFTDFRIRQKDGMARIQVTEDELGKVFENRETILKMLKKYYSAVFLDLEVR